ncbi:MAG: 4a-hydroxytetrahydrobiopterin dehydratase [Planctomycetota bacterium]
MPEPLPEADIHAALANLPGWSFQDHALHKTYEFADFKAAFAWMTAVAFEAEALAHHPAWHNVYKTVRVQLNTHDAGNRVTQLDVDLAKKMDALA